MIKEVFENENLLKVFGVYGKPIEGVKIMSLSRIPDERGEVCHMLRNDDPIFEKFGEVYFSIAYPGAVKAWHKHTQMTLNYAVISGKIKLVIFDTRENYPTKGNLIEIFTGDNNYFLIQIPSMVWNGYKCIGTEKSIVANCSTLPHIKEEMQRLPYNSSEIPYDWVLKNQ